MPDTATHMVNAPIMISERLVDSTRYLLRDHGICLDRPWGRRLSVKPPCTEFSTALRQQIPLGIGSFLLLRMCSCLFDTAAVIAFSIPLLNLVVMDARKNADGTSLT
jgi:hypothetical protein